jgi:hypothetical protein
MKRYQMRLARELVQFTICFQSAHCLTVYRNFTKKVVSVNISIVEKGEARNAQTGIETRTVMFV